MKRYILLLLCLPLLSYAQFSFGIMGGANMGRFGGVEPPDINYARRTGLNFGVTLAYRVAPDINITLQPTFSQRGSTIETGEDTRWDSLQVYQANIDFLVLPLFIRIDADNGVSYIISGLELGIPLSSRVIYEQESWNISQKLKKTDILASIGMGLKFSLGRPLLRIEVRYYQGLITFNRDSEKHLDRVIFENFKNSGFQIMTGLEWELHK